MYILSLNLKLNFIKIILKFIIKLLTFITLQKNLLSLLVIKRPNT